jgi:parallel beta-helix repeat protein
VQHRILNIRAVGNGWDGIRLSGYGHLIDGCTATENGVYSVGTAWGHGIAADDGCTVTGNTAYSNEHTGISTGVGSTLIGNTAYKNRHYGFNPLLGSTVRGNTSRWNESDGFHGTYGCSITGNTSSYNDGRGFWIAPGSTVIGNTAHGNATWGINFSADANSFVDQNTAFDNTGGNMSACASCTFGTNHAP